MGFRGNKRINDLAVKFFIAKSFYYFKVRRLYFLKQIYFLLLRIFDLTFQVYLPGINREITSISNIIPLKAHESIAILSESEGGNNSQRLGYST